MLNKATNRKFLYHFLFMTLFQLKKDGGNWKKIEYINQVIKTKQYSGPMFLYKYRPLMIML